MGVGVGAGVMSPEMALVIRLLGGREVVIGEGLLSTLFCSSASASASFSSSSASSSTSSTLPGNKEVGGLGLGVSAVEDGDGDGVVIVGGGGGEKKGDEEGESGGDGSKWMKKTLIWMNIATDGLDLVATALAVGFGGLGVEVGGVAWRMFAVAGLMVGVGLEGWWFWDN